jgi:predicted ATPase with chaperone activity
MGKGNVQKEAAKREKNQKKLEAQKKGGGSVKESVAKAHSIQCAFCKQTFLQNTNKIKLEEHVATHDKAKKTFNDCFPNYQ